MKPDLHSCCPQGERFCAGNEKQDSRTIASEDPTATCVVRHSTLTGKANRRVQAPTLRKQELIASFFLNGIPGTRYLFLLWLPLWGAFLQRTADDSFGSCEERPIATRPPCPGVSAKHLDVLRVTGKEAMPVIDAGQGAWIVNKRVRSGHAEVRLCSRPGLVFRSFYRQNLNASPFEKGASL